MLKRLFFTAVTIFGILGSGHAQQNSIVGKWKVSGVYTKGMSLDLENPASIKKLIADQMSKEGGKVDSAAIEIAYTAITSVFTSMQLEYTPKGQFIMQVPTENGVKRDTLGYSIDYAKNVLTAKKAGSDKVDESSFKFDGNDIVVVATPKKDNTTLRLRRIKD